MWFLYMPSYRPTHKPHFEAFRVCENKKWLLVPRNIFTPTRRTCLPSRTSNGSPNWLHRGDVASRFLILLDVLSVSCMRLSICRNETTSAKENVYIFSVEQQTNWLYVLVFVIRTSQLNGSAQSTRNKAATNKTCRNNSWQKC